MNQQNHENQNLQKDLISEYEAMSQKGTVGFYEETVFLTLIDHYQEAELFTKAMEVIEHATRQHAFSVTFHKKKAQLLLEKGCATQALDCLDLAAAYAPSDFEISILRVEGLSMLGYINEAHGVLDNLKYEMCTSYERSEINLSRALLFEIEQEFTKMFYALRDSILEEPQNTDTLGRIWFSVEMSRRFRESIDLHQKLIDIDPYNYVAWYNLGYSYNAIRDYTNAADAFEYAYIINDHFEFAYRDCANACIEIGEYQRALDCYQEALDRVKPDSEILTNIGFCMESLQNFEKANSFYLKAIQLDPQDDNIYFRLGESYSKEHKWLSAVAAYEKALSIEKRNEEYYSALGKCYFQLGEIKEAKKYLRKAIEIAPEISECWILYTNFLLETGAVDKAIENIDMAQMHACGLELNFCKVACLFAANRRKDALACLNDTLEEYEFDSKDIFQFLPDCEHDIEVLSIIAIHQDR
jgi:tetratricopeptide (TPR) repeat protein